jgi:tetratricopeptide (TPR) repeat protein
MVGFAAMQRKRLAVLVAALAACHAMPPTHPNRLALPDFDAEWNYADPAGTEARFRALAATAPDADLGWRVELQTQIARTYSLRADFGAAHATLDAVAGDLAAAGAVARARYLLERGRTHNSADERGRATELFREAFAVADAAGAQVFAADALHMLGISTPPDDALAWNARAIEYCEGCTDVKARRWLGPLYHNTWVAHLERGELDTALSYAEKSRAFRASIGDAQGERIGRWSLAHTLRKQGRIEAALAELEQLAADCGPDGDPSGYTQEELGECLLALDRGDAARPHFAAAHALLKDDVWLRRDEPARLARLKTLAEGAP